MRSPQRLHERHNFFKYMPADTAVSVLKSRALRWSSPNLFNDPFDVPREFSTGITSQAIFAAVSMQMIKLIEDPPADTSVLKLQLRLIANKVKEGISEDLKKQLIQNLIDIGASQHPMGESLEELRNLWKETIPNLRLLCLTESPAHMAMWHHYADQYRGIVIELKCIDELDSAWLTAKPVVYPTDKPPIYTADGWAALSMLESGLNTILLSATLSKSPDWSYEKEWRVTSLKRDADSGDFTDYPFFEQEIGSIYFGPKITAADRQNIIQLASANYSNANFFDVSIGLDREFIFNSVDK